MLLALSVPLAYAITNTYVKRRFKGLPALPIGLAARIATECAVATVLGLTKLLHQFGTLAPKHQDPVLHVLLELVDGALEVLVLTRLGLRLVGEQRLVHHLIEMGRCNSKRRIDQDDLLAG